MDFWFLLDNNVDARAAQPLRERGHRVTLAAEAGLGGAEPATDDEVTVYAHDRGMIVVTHDREFTQRRRRSTIGLHVRVVVEQPDAMELLPSGFQSWRSGSRGRAPRSSR